MEKQSVWVHPPAVINTSFGDAGANFNSMVERGLILIAWLSCLYNWPIMAHKGLCTGNERG